MTSVSRPVGGKSKLILSCRQRLYDSIKITGLNFHVHDDEVDNYT